MPDIVSKMSSVKPLTNRVPTIYTYSPETQVRTNQDFQRIIFQYIPILLSMEVYRVLLSLPDSKSSVAYMLFNQTPKLMSRSDAYLNLLLSPINIIHSHNIILSHILPILHLYYLQRYFTGIFKSVKG